MTKSCFLRHFCSTHYHRDSFFIPWQVCVLRNVPRLQTPHWSGARSNSSVAAKCGFSVQSKVEPPWEVVYPWQRCKTYWHLVSSALCDGEMTTRSVSLFISSLHVLINTSSVSLLCILDVNVSRCLKVKLNEHNNRLWWSLYNPVHQKTTRKSYNHGYTVYNRICSLCLIIFISWVKAPKAVDSFPFVWEVPLIPGFWPRQRLPARQETHSQIWTQGDMNVWYTVILYISINTVNSKRQIFAFLSNSKKKNTIHLL